MPDYTNPMNRLALLLTKKEEVVNVTPIRLPKVPKPKAKPVSVDWSKLNSVVEAPVSVAQETKELVTITSSDKLGSLLDKALKKYEEILDITVDPKDDNYCTLLRIQASACEKIVGTQTKVDENVLRARNDSRLGNILERLVEAKKRLNLTVNLS